MEQNHPKCLVCNILFDVPCANAACEGHQNERIGKICVYCATHEREKTEALEEAFGLCVAG